MAKGKKKESLTPEERLQAALVPESEQRYKVPDNWCWLTQNSIATFLNGRAYKQDELLEDSTNTPVLRVGNLFTNSSWYYSNLELDSDKYIDNGDLIYAWSASFGPFIWDGNRVIYHYHIWKVLLSSAIHKKYMYFWLLYDTERLKQGGHGTGMIHVTKAMMEAAPIPLPSIYEQQRIVDSIESLFAKLDAAKQKAQDALDSFETRKAAILHKAFNGELTAQWRKDHGVGLESWDNAALQDVCEKIVCGKTPTGFIQPTGEIPYLKVYNIVDNNIDFKSTPQFIPKEIHEGKLKSSILKPNDVVMNIVGPPLRKIAIIPVDYPEWNMNQAIVRFRPGASLQYRFLYYALVNPETLDDVISETKGVVGQANISVTQSRNLVIPLPSVSEQTEIVRILDDLLAKEQQAKEAAEGVLEQIDLIKKAILARAFRGALGTNDPSEESAVELLKTCYCGELQS